MRFEHLFDVAHGEKAPVDLKEGSWLIAATRVARFPYEQVVAKKSGADPLGKPRRI
jgi:hypothetical protein